MISHLRGRIVAKGPGGGPERDVAAVVVDVGGVGYRVLVPAPTIARLPAVGTVGELHTSLQVREDAMTLYGFAAPEARDLFESLLTASGVGPKLALAALSTHQTDALRRAIVDGDVDVLTVIPGVGRKSAQRLVLELRDRLAAAAAADDGAGTPRISGAIAEVRLALLGLGYTASEVQRGLEGLDPDLEADALLRDALRTLSGDARRAGSRR